MKYDDQKIICPKCGTKMLMMYGWGWDYDRWICPKRKCDYEIELEVSTYPEEAGE